MTTPNLTIITQKLAHIVEADAIAEAFALLFPGIAQASGHRLQRAAEICRHAGSCQPGDQPDTYLVRSSSNSRGRYIVDTREQSCSCPDHGQAESRGIKKKRICKHRLAVGFFLYGHAWLRQTITERRQEKPIKERLQSARNYEGQRFAELCQVIDRCERYAQQNGILGGFNDLPDDLQRQWRLARIAHEDAMQIVIRILNQDLD